MIRVTHDLRAIWPVQFGGNVHFHICPEKDHGRAKFGQISELEITCQNRPIVNSLASGFQNYLSWSATIKKVICRK